MVRLVRLVRMPLTISDHLRLCPPTLQCHSDTHCISSHNHATPVERRCHGTPHLPHPHAPDHLRLHPPTLRCHSDTHCVSSHNHATPVTGLNLDQCLISPDFVPMSWATTYLSFSPYAAFA